MVCVLVLSCFDHVRLFLTLWTAACQAPLPMGFSREEYRSGLSFPTPGYLPDLRIKLLHLLHWQVDSLPLHHRITCYQKLKNAFSSSVPIQEQSFENAFLL